MFKLFLVTGATGATGSKTVRFLLESGARVRAFVHREDERSATLAALGAEMVTGDLLDFEAVRNSLEGVQSAYFVYPIMPGLLQATAYFAQAAKEAKLSAIVNMSQISARREARSHAAHDHWIAERIRLVRNSQHSPAANTIRRVGFVLDRSDQDGNASAAVWNRQTRSHHR